MLKKREEGDKEEIRISSEFIRINTKKVKQEMDFIEKDFKIKLKSLTADFKYKTRKLFIWYFFILTIIFISHISFEFFSVVNHILMILVAMFAFYWINERNKRKHEFSLFMARLDTMKETMESIDRITRE